MRGLNERFGIYGINLNQIVLIISKAAISASFMHVSNYHYTSEGLRRIVVDKCYDIIGLGSGHGLRRLGVMISASHEGCHGTFPMYEPIMLHTSRCREHLAVSTPRVSRCREYLAVSKEWIHYVVRATRLHRSIVLNTNVAT